MLWTLYMDEYGLKDIAFKLKRTVHEVMCKKWKLICANGRAKAGSVLVYGPDCRGARWRKRDVQVLRLARDANVPLKRIAELLGRTVAEVQQQLNPRQGMSTFFRVKEVR